MKFFRWLKLSLFGAKHKVFVGDQLVTTIRVRPHTLVRVNLKEHVLTSSSGVIRFDPPINRTQRDEPIVIEYRYK